MSIIVYGARLYGRVDSVPGVLHVGTRFLHAFYVPLVPTGSFLVVKNGRRSWLRGNNETLPLQRLSWRSILAAWLRALLMSIVVGATIVGTTMVLVEASYRYTVPTFSLLAACLAGFVVSYRFTRASPRRLEALASAGVPPSILARARAELESAK